MAKKTPVPANSFELDKWLRKLRHNIPAITLLLIGFTAGVLWFGALRFMLVHPHETHYHSNFAVYIDGAREEFKSFTYYEEISACSSEFANNPKGRTHLHENMSDVIHVHDKRVTYADFFSNIDWTLGPNFVRAAGGLLAGNAEKSWVFILNGEKLDRIDNLVIGDQDKLLISYGPAGTDFTAQYGKIENKAKEVDEESDPASCSGLNGPGSESFSARLKRTIGISE
ncbi:hypothetical protein BH10PAT3_BH10PAT3_2150 [soil metagenome]